MGAAQNKSEKWTVRAWTGRQSWTKQRPVLGEVQWRLCGEGQSSGNSDIVEESDKLVTDGEGHGTAQDLEGEMDWNKNPGKRETRKCT